MKRSWVGEFSIGTMGNFHLVLTAHYFRTRNLRVYGMSEILLGVATAFGVTIESQFQPTQALAIIGATYVVARGFNNVAEARHKAVKSSATGAISPMLARSLQVLKIRSDLDPCLHLPEIWRVLLRRLHRFMQKLLKLLLADGLGEFDGIEFDHEIQVLCAGRPFSHANIRSVLKLAPRRLAPGPRCMLHGRVRGTRRDVRAPNRGDCAFRGLPTRRRLSPQPLETRRGQPRGDAVRGEILH